MGLVYPTDTTVLLYASPVTPGRTKTPRPVKARALNLLLIIPVEGLNAPQPDMELDPSSARGVDCHASIRQCGAVHPYTAV